MTLGEYNNLANDFRPKLRHWCPHLVNPGCATVKNVTMNFHTPLVQVTLRLK